MSLVHKRILVGFYLLVLGASALNVYFDWGYFGTGRGLLAVVGLIGAVAAAKFGPSLLREIETHQAARRTTTSGGNK